MAASQKKMATKADNRLTDPSRECSVTVLWGVATRLQNQVAADAKELKENRTVMTRIAKAATMHGNATTTKWKANIRPV